MPTKPSVLQQEFWLLPAAVTNEQLFAAMPYQWQLQSPNQQSYRLWDTRTGELWQAGILLACSSSQLYWCDRKQQRQLLLSQPPNHNELLRLLPQLSALCKMRSLQASDVEVQISTSLLLVRNQREKLVLRAQLIVLTYQQNQQCYLCLEPLRGFDKAAHRVRCELTALGCIPSSGNHLRQFLREQQLDLAQYSPQFSWPLTAEQRADEQVLAMLTQLLTQARSNEVGIIADEDSEWLHDYRVWMRRARALLSLSQPLFPAATQWGQTLANLVRSTNNLRDLDVCLLTKGDYQRWLDSAQQQALELGFEWLAQQRLLAQAAVKRQLRSQSYLEQLQLLEQQVQQQPLLDESPACGEFAAQILAQAFKRLWRLLVDVNQRSSGEQLHQLRLAAKKLRYALELWAGLLHGPLPPRFIKSLKKLQAALGHYHDCCMQQLLFAQLAQQFADDAAMLSALQQLSTQLLKRQRIAQKAALQACQRFSKKRNKRAFMLLIQALSEEDLKACAS